MKCCVCGNESRDLKEYKSSLCNTFKSYCDACIVSGFEPYEDLTNFGWEYEMFSKTFQRKILDPTLIYNRKSKEQFNSDVNNKRKQTYGNNT
jgi:hypothetical protein